MGVAQKRDDVALRKLSETRRLRSMRGAQLRRFTRNDMMMWHSVSCQKPGVCVVSLAMT